MATPPTGRPVGRPSTYDPSFCEITIAAGEEGESLAGAAKRIGVTRSTMYEWAKVHPEFADAIARSRELSLAWWEAMAASRLIEHHQGAKLNSQVWSRSMAARFPDDYREKVEINGTINIADRLAAARKRVGDSESEES